MWFALENVLTQQDFFSISRTVKLFQNRSVSEDDFYETNDNHLNEEHGVFLQNKRQRKVDRVRYNYKSHYKTIYEDTYRYFGNEFKPLVLNIISQLEEKGYNDVVLQNLWLQYSDSTSIFHRHRDGGLGQYKDTESFTSVFYTHSEWHDSWGGQLKITNSGTETGLYELNESIYTYTPKPNSLIVWTRDHPHWVDPIINSNIIRSFVGGCWYRDATKV